jgi:hypothetical protein
MAENITRQNTSQKVADDGFHHDQAAANTTETAFGNLLC